MANYCCAVRTNYFHVKDPEAFREFMKTVTASEDRIYVWESKDNGGKTVFGFGCYSTILGVESEGGDTDYDEFVNTLAELVAEDDAIIIIESGNEKLRYLVGSATIITGQDIEYLEIDTIAAESAAAMLKNKSWKTKMWY